MTPDPVQKAAIVAGDNDLVKDAIDFTDRASRKISAYPEKLRTEPPLPHGFMEGALMGLAVYLAFTPVRSVTAKYIARTQGDMIKNMYGMIFFAGQLTVSATATLYGAVYIGSKEWLSIVTDYASASTTSTDFRDVHKAILADEFCEDKVVQKHRFHPRIQTVSNTNPPSDVSVMEWVKNPEKVIVDELFRAVKACRDRNQG